MSDFFLKWQTHFCRHMTVLKTFVSQQINFMMKKKNQMPSQVKWNMCSFNNGSIVTPLIKTDKLTNDCIYCNNIRT